MFFQIKINKLNQDFYKSIGAYFDNSRQYFWPGWDILVDKLSELGLFTNEDFKVADLACGNGRLAEFWDQKNLPMTFYGLDADEFLLQKASQKEYQNIQTFFEVVDLYALDWSKSLPNELDLITCFGFFHHIADLHTLSTFLNQVQVKLKSNGYFILATWEFLNSERLKKLVVDKNSTEFMELLCEYDLEAGDFGASDYILSWDRGQKAYRFARVWEESELGDVLESSGFRLIDTYFADGKEGNINKYWICQKKPARSGAGI